MIVFVWWCNFFYCVFVWWVICMIEVYNTTLFEAHIQYFYISQIFFSYHQLCIKLSIESDIIYTDWYGMTGKCSKYSKKCNIYLFIVCVLGNYIVSLTDGSRSIICFVVEMCFRHLVTISVMKFICSNHRDQTLISHCIVWNVNHWKLHILILTIRIWFHFYYHDPFHN